MSPLSISLLGFFQLELDNQNITDTLRTAKERALLAYLTVESDRSHTREALAELLWPEKPEGVARTNLRQALLGVRRAIGDRDLSKPYLNVDDDTIQFNRDQPFWIDTDAFNTHIQNTFTHAHKSLETCLYCAQHLQAAVDLYRGDFMEGSLLLDSPGFQEWVVFHREQYLRYLLSALQTLSDYFRLVGKFELAHKYAYRLVSLDPLDESAHRRLMVVLAMSGKRAAALEQFLTCRRILQSELGVAPSVETETLYDKIKNGEALRVDTGTLKRVNLPAQFTPFYGRESELEWLAQSLANPIYRFITIVGPGGIGKTRLALQAAEINSEPFPDGVRYISLDTIVSPDLIIPSIVQALGFPFRGDAEPKKQLIRFLRPLRTLLVMDSIEYHLDQAGLILEILQQAPGVKFLVTSRQRLHYQAATLLEVKGLAYPTEVNDPNAVNYPAVRLFLSRAARIQAGFVATEKDLVNIIQICKAVDGLPLAIELAAARLREFSSELIWQEMQQNIDVLQASMLDIPERHASMRTVFEQSWKPLAGNEKAVYRKLSVFTGKFTLDAAQRIADASLPVLTTLMDKSLLQGDASRGFTLHPLWKQFTGVKLAENREELELTLDLHQDYYLDFLRQHDIDLRIGTHKKKTVEELEAQIENIHAAVARTSSLKGSPALQQGVEMLKRFYDFQNELQAMQSYREVFQADESHQEGTVNQPISFKPETHQLLEILSNSYYTDREVFLRELISNAANALTQVETALFAKHEVLDPEAPLVIRISVDPTEKILTIDDTGIGMTAEEMGEKLGLKVQVGERAFVEVAKGSISDFLEDMIGSFGAGFYSAYLVAEMIRVESRSSQLDARGAVWTSMDSNTFTIAPCDKVERGTRIILRLRGDAVEFMQEQRLKDIIRKYSDFIPFPIYLGNSEEQVNRRMLLWRKMPQDVVKKDYVDFYQQFTLDFEAPLAYEHIVLDTPTQVHAILYVPCYSQHGPFSLRKEDGLKLYSGNVLIQEYCNDLLPDYFRFVQGVVDSEDLPLNVSREALQSNRLMVNLKKLLTDKVVEMLKRLAYTDPEVYARFWLEYGSYIESGVATEGVEPENLYPLLRFRTIDRLDRCDALEEYVQHIPPGQTAIYYIVSDNDQALIHDPHLGALRQLGYNALVFTDPASVYMAERIGTYQDYPLVNVVDANLALSESETGAAGEAAESKLNEDFASLVARVRSILGNRVENVRINCHLRDVPARLVDVPEAVPQTTARIQPFRVEGNGAPKQVLELNPGHLILVQLNSLPVENPLSSLIIEQVYENARLAASIQTRAR
jgi:HSP90 family molecular chaperone/predicted ATPase/DNA-binding SARP family transcriptional activator